MTNQPRNVTGGEAVLTGIVPGLNIFNYFLGWLSVPIEAFLRRDFGERYLTTPNFWAGLIILFVFRFASSLLGLLNPLSWLRGGDASPESWMGSIINCYMLVCLIHFARIQWNDFMGIPVHSFESGRSWLLFIGKRLIGIMNALLRKLLQLVFKIFPNAKPKRFDPSQPLLTNEDQFTERFVEPMTVFFLAILCWKMGQMSVGFWLMSSVAALNYSTGIRHRAQRNMVLDVRDQIIERNEYLMAINGQKSRRAVGMMINETAREAEKTPEIIPIIREKNPTLADAIAAKHAQSKKHVTVEEDLNAAIAA